MKISIVVCTYNRDDVLGNCLTSLETQTASKDQYEVIIVDNNSTDRTEGIAKEFCKKNSNFILIKELKQGLSNARNRGYKEASGEYVGYIDDDAKVERDYIEVAANLIQEKKSDIFGGPIYPYYNQPKPEWFKDEYGNHAVYDEEGTLGSDGRYLSGSNILIRKTLLEELGGFSSKLGMQGLKMGYHEETALQMEAQKKGKSIYYSLNLVVYHLVQPFKMTPIFYLYKAFNSGKDALSLLERNYKTSDIYSVPSEVDNLFKELESAVKSRDIDKYPYPENYLIEVVYHQIYELGLKTEFLIQKAKSSTAISQYIKKILRKY